ncbi:hypothetical protein DFJ77DRAFT_92838 [Powellomyces hirtus]|nr:hypothetical protein DFJ77DRAFT_282575 [Powellomyces hirtus]KAI8911275.1 hypothetical protein DFJ77DRAFT_92838 [Powellomyces hirtus]
MHRGTCVFKGSGSSSAFLGLFLIHGISSGRSIFQNSTIGKLGARVESSLEEKVCEADRRWWLNGQWGRHPGAGIRIKPVQHLCSFFTGCGLDGECP